MLWLALFAIWPAIHASLVIRHDVSPWKLFGWAMYVKPILPEVVRLSTDQGQERIPIPRGILTERSKRALDAFRDDRTVLGDLRRPDELGQTILEERTGFDNVTVSLQKMRIRPESDTVVIQIRRYEYHR